MERDKFRFLQHLFPSTKKEWKDETFDKSETLKQVSSEDTFQNGYNDKSFKLSETTRLGHFPRLGRCLYAHSNISKTSTVPSVLYSRPMFSVESSLFWCNLSTSVLHKDSSSRCSPSTGPEHSTSFKPRRLVGSKPSQTSFMPRLREVSPSFSFTRVHSKQGKVRTCAQTGNHLHRGTVPFQPRDSHSNTRQGKKS